MSTIVIGTVLGFITWNWPQGKIFLGDGGAYLIGFIIIELSILLISRNYNISSWFVLLILIYPIFETIFSIYRRRFIHGQSPGKPDRLHLHTLIYLRIVVGNKNKIQRNSKVAKYLWTISLVTSGWGIIFYKQTYLLMTGVILFCCTYIILYRQIVRWRIQHLKRFI